MSFKSKFCMEGYLDTISNRQIELTGYGIQK